MQRISLHDLNESTVGSLHSAVEVCDAAGVPLGVFVPSPRQLPGEPEFDWDGLREELQMPSPIYPRSNIFGED